MKKFNLKMTVSIIEYIGIISNSLKDEHQYYLKNKEQNRDHGFGFGCAEMRFTDFVAFIGLRCYTIQRVFKSQDASIYFEWIEILI